MKIIKTYGYLFLLIIIYSCQEKKNLLVKQFKDSGDRGEFEYIINKGDTILDGNFVIYDDENKKISTGKYFNGEPKGKQYFFYSNGNIESIHYRKNKKIYEESVYYHESGKLRKYVLYDDFGESVFIIRFDSKENVINYEGLPLIELYHLREKKYKKYKIGDTLQYKLIIAEIPKSTKKVKIELKNFDNSKLKRELTKIEPVGMEVKELILKKGMNQIKATVEFEFNDIKKTKIEDSILIDFDGTVRQTV